jgi:hypothetical protein
MAYGAAGGEAGAMPCRSTGGTWNQQYTATPARALAGASPIDPCPTCLPPTIDPVAAARWAALSVTASPARPSGAGGGFALAARGSGATHGGAVWPGSNCGRKPGRTGRLCGAGCRRTQLLAQSLSGGRSVLLSEVQRPERLQTFAIKTCWRNRGGSPARWTAAPTRFRGAPRRQRADAVGQHAAAPGAADPQALMAQLAPCTLAVDGFPDVLVLRSGHPA